MYRRWIIKLIMYKLCTELKVHLSLIRQSSPPLALGRRLLNHVYARHDITIQTHNTHQECTNKRVTGLTVSKSKSNSNFVFAASCTFCAQKVCCSLNFVVIMNVRNKSIHVSPWSSILVFVSNDIETLDLPSRSLYANLTEYIWSLTTKKLRERPAYTLKRLMIRLHEFGGLLRVENALTRARSF